MSHIEEFRYIFEKETMKPGAVRIRELAKKYNMTKDQVGSWFRYRCRMIEQGESLRVKQREQQKERRAQKRASIAQKSKAQECIIDTVPASSSVIIPAGQVPFDIDLEFYSLFHVEPEDEMFQKCFT